MGLMAGGAAVAWLMVTVTVGGGREWLHRVAVAPGARVAGAAAECWATFRATLTGRTLRLVGQGLWLTTKRAWHWTECRRLGVSTRMSPERKAALLREWEQRR